MTDNDIICAMLRYSKTNILKVDGELISIGDILDLINRKDAEIDKCHKQLDELKFLESRVNSIKNTSKDTFTGILLTIAEGVGFQEAVEEFEKRLKGKALTTIRGGQLGVIDCYDIEKIAKEMVGKS